MRYGRWETVLLLVRLGPEWLGRRVYPTVVGQRETAFASVYRVDSPPL